MSPTNPITRYLLSSRTQTCGIGWTPRQIAVAHATFIALTLAVLLAAYANGLDWSWAQYVVTAQKWVMGAEVAIALGLFLSPPAGFEWLVPVYFLKLLVGYTAKE